MKSGKFFDISGAEKINTAKENIRKIDKIEKKICVDFSTIVTLNHSLAEASGKLPQDKIISFARKLTNLYNLREIEKEKRIAYALSGELLDLEKTLFPTPSEVLAKPPKLKKEEKIAKEKEAQVKNDIKLLLKEVIKNLSEWIRVVNIELNPSLKVGLSLVKEEEKEIEDPVASFIQENKALKAEVTSLKKEVDSLKARLESLGEKENMSDLLSSVPPAYEEPDDLEVAPSAPLEEKDDQHVETSDSVVEKRPSFSPRR